MSEEVIQKLMAQAQVFACAWSVFGGPFDTGDGLAVAEEERSLLEKMIREALEGQP